MARKGKETDVQVFVKTDEEWEKLKEPQVKMSSILLNDSPDCDNILTDRRVSSPWWTSTASGRGPVWPWPTTSRRSSWR